MVFIFFTDNSFAGPTLSSFKSLQQQMPKKYDNNDFKSTNCQENSHQENYFHSSDSQRWYVNTLKQIKTMSK